jgi:two-component system, sensor histidine kinase
LPETLLLPTAPRRAHPMLRILIVDDDRDTPEPLRFPLELWGHHVLTAISGTAAIKAVEHFRPDVVILDLALRSKPSGYDVARQIRQQAGKQPVIICVSGYGREEERHPAHEAGWDHHLVKPAGLGELHRILGAVQAKAALPA